MGTGPTSAAAGLWGRNSVGVEVDREYFSLSEQRLTTALHKHSAGVVIANGTVQGGQECLTSKKNSVMPFAISGASVAVSKKTKAARPARKTQEAVQL